MPCRGSGKLISSLGGAPSEVTCPWCEGGGVRLAGVDAQARWSEGGEGKPGAAAGTPGAARPGEAGGAGAAA
jgi:hypothetical protein